MQTQAHASRTENPLLGVQIRKPKVLQPEGKKVSFETKIKHLTCDRNQETIVLL